MAKLRVRFDDPEHGWIGLSVTGDGVALEQSFSYTPHDSFFDLVTALSMTFQGDGESVVTWSAEPIEFDFKFGRAEGGTRLIIERHPDDQRLKRRGEVVAELSGSFDEICLPFWRALRDLESRFSREDLEKRWHRAFPFEELRRLTSRLGK